MALSARVTQPCPELVEQWISLLACWQILTVNRLALFASAFDWSKPCFFGQASSHSARGLLTAASDPNFRNFAVQHRWHEHSEAALVSLLHARAGPMTTRLPSSDCIARIASLGDALSRTSGPYFMLTDLKCVPCALLDTHFDKRCQLADSGTFCRSLDLANVSHPCHFMAVVHWHYDRLAPLPQPCHHVPQTGCFICALTLPPLPCVCSHFSSVQHATLLLGPTFVAYEASSAVSALPPWSAVMLASRLASCAVRPPWRAERPARWRPPCRGGPHPGLPWRLRLRGPLLS